MKPTVPTEMHVMFHSPVHSKFDPALEYIVFIVDSVRGHIAVKYSE